MRSPNQVSFLRRFQPLSPEGPAQEQHEIETQTETQET
jgi:hypothetical protein